MSAPSTTTAGSLAPKSASRFADEREHLSATQFLEAEAVMDADGDNVEAFLTLRPTLSSKARAPHTGICFGMSPITPRMPN